jgi:hypothetical protein
MNRWGERLERVRQWRETMVSLSCIAVVLGVVVNLLAASLYEKNWNVALLFLLGTGLLLAFTSNFLYRRFAADEEGFECVIPLTVDPGQNDVGILILPPYPSSSAMHQAMSVALRREPELKGSLVASFANRGTVDPFHRPQPLWMFLHAIVFYELLDGVRQYANRSLGHGSVHGPWASISADLAKERRKVRDLDRVLWATLARFKEPASEDLSIHLPPGTTLSVQMSETTGIPTGFTLTTRYASLSATISRFWSSASPASKTGRAACRLAGQLQGQYDLLRRIDRNEAHLWIGRIPITISIRFRPLWVFSQRAELVYAWVAECAEYLRDRLAWSSVLEGEVERLLVELHEKIEAFGEKSLPQETQ